ncbi:hypothetical protein WJX73_008430 [Symbiochloris irregularis]|uniref:Sugar phosphate transporter domain-containing protein n=1 Tax=Symbiochloris irregularis TaxID=706552 RepID=A0AAW1NX01_9CHLO
MGFSFLALAPYMATPAVRVKHRETLQKQWKGVCAIGVFMATNIALNNTSLVNMTLTLNQIIRASIPVFTCLLAVGIEKKVPSKGEAGSLFLLTAGVMLAVWEGKVAGTTQAIVLCVAGTICNAAMMSTTGKLLSDRIDVLRLTFYTAPVSCACLFPLFLYYELNRFIGYKGQHALDMYGIIIMTSAIALSYNVVHSLMIQQTSAVTTTVLGEAKIVGLMILSYLLLGEKRVFTLRLTAGCTIAILGFCLYSHFKLWAQKPVVRAATPDPEAKPLVAKSQNHHDESSKM